MSPCDGARPRPGAAQPAYFERPRLGVVKVDVDRAPPVGQRYDVLAIPTAKVLRDGEPVGKRVTGALPRKRWESALRLDELAPRSGG